MAPSAIRDLRRVLRYRNLVVRQATRMKNRIAGLLMETGTPYNKERLHGRAYFSELLGSLREVPRSVVELLKLGKQAQSIPQSAARRECSTGRECDDTNRGYSDIPGLSDSRR